MKNVKAYVRTTLTAGLILAPAQAQMRTEPDAAGDLGQRHRGDDTRAALRQRILEDEGKA